MHDDLYSFGTTSKEEFWVESFELEVERIVLVNKANRMKTYRMEIQVI